MSKGEEGPSPSCRVSNRSVDKADVDTALHGDRLASNESTFDAKGREEENAATPSPDATARAMATARFELRLTGRIRRRDCRFELLVLIVFSNDKIDCERGDTVMVVCAVLPILQFHTVPPSVRKKKYIEPAAG